MIGATGTPTFRGRLTLGVLAVALGALGAASGTIYVGARRTLAAHLDETLLAIARVEIASALDDPRGGVHVHEEQPFALALPAGITGYEKVALLSDARRVVIARTHNLEDGPALPVDPALHARALGGEPVLVDVERGGLRWRAVYHPLRDPAGAPLVAVVAIPCAPVARALQALLGALALALVLGTAAAAWGAAQLARRFTRPLEEMATAARAVGEDNLSARIPDTAPHAELRALTGILNAMLARIETAFGTQRRFVADASHELRSPLANLRGTIEVALRRPRSPDEYQRTLAVAVAEIERLSRLVGQLLTLSRADAGRMTLHRTRCDLRALAATAVDAHAARASDRGVVLRVEGNGALPLFGDADRLREVLDNLLDNALRHAPPGSTIAVRTAREAERATVSVVDAGPGLTAEQQAHVFERFYRADASRTRDSGGAGLGLAIASAIAAAHAGTLSVSSTPGHGATFTLALSCDGA